MLPIIAKMKLSSQFTIVISCYEGSVRNATRQPVVLPCIAFLLVVRLVGRTHCSIGASLFLDLPKLVLQLMAELCKFI